MQIELPHNSRKISRTPLFKESFGGQARNFSIFTLIKLVAVLAIAAAFIFAFYCLNKQKIKKTTILQEAVNTNPGDSNKRLQLALAYEEEFKTSNNYQFLHNAQEEAKVALELDPQNLNAAKVLWRLNRADSDKLEREIWQVNEILKVRPDYQAAWLKLATLYEKLGDKNSASAALEKAKLLNQNF